MLTITVPATDVFDDATQEFIQTQATIVEFEHSLVSLSKWESKWEVAFMGKQDKTKEQLLDYIRCMTLTKGISEEVYNRLSSENLEAINEYINAKMTATTFNEPPNKAPSREVITAELIYYWMTALSIPLDFETRHLNHLLTLIRVCNLKNTPQKKPGRPTRSSLADRARINAQRRAANNSTG